MQVPTEKTDEVLLQHIELIESNTSDFSVVPVRVEGVVVELRRQHDTGRKQSVDIESADHEVWMHLQESVDVDQAQNQAPIAAMVILSDPGQVIMNSDIRHNRCVEDRRAVLSGTERRQVCQHIGRCGDQAVLADSVELLLKGETKVSGIGDGCLGGSTTETTATLRLALKFPTM
eukprot:CAMPEP_0115306962 /NCGR_PEP_ID=MMETSP0270-20121206/72876_1 /TAXON_ID=71861 /ORGANISM="Scrippsiella trochoidea, Strain CCMP3099" /LENGTH=174 /DNA_ID=CAMNT_0002725351 /DNA_START=136 /DNA_END=660 /DNA_ORIENTATION=-